MRIADFTVPEISKFHSLCNFSDMERKCFDMKTKECSNVQIAMELNISESTVSVIMRRVRAKIITVMNWRD